MVRAAAFAVVFSLVVAACSDSGTTSTSQAPPTTQPPATTQPAPTSSTTAPPTTVAPATTAPPATAAPVTEIVVAPNAPLAGVELGTEAEAAVTALTAVFGPPDDDTGWFEGCPFDGAGDNERFVTWGGLTAQMYRYADGDEFGVWTYQVPLGPSPRPVVLPGGAAMGDPLAAVAATLGAGIEYTGVFDASIAVVDGLMVWGNGQPEGAVVDVVGVPFVATCD